MRFYEFDASKTFNFNNGVLFLFSKKIKTRKREANFLRTKILLNKRRNQKIKNQMSLDL